MIRPFRGAAGYAASLTLACVAAPAAHAQGSTMAYVALRGMAQGVFHGESTDAAHKDDIVPISLTISQPYGAATPVLHVVADVGVAPQIVRSLVTDELLVNPTVIFVRPSINGTLQQAYRIAAPHGYVTGATISLDAAHMPTVAFDLMLSGGTSYTDQTGAATTEAPPSISGSAPAAHGLLLTGEFTGRSTGDFPGVPGTPLRGKEILLDSVGVTIMTPVTNGTSAGKSIVYPLVVARPTSEDAALFDNARSAQEPFSKMTVHVYLPQPNGQLTDVFDLETKNACFDLGGATACGQSTTGMTPGKPGGVAGLAPSGGGASGGAQSSRAGGVMPALRRSVSDASTAMRFVIPELTLTNRRRQITITHSFATNTTN